MHIAEGLQLQHEYEQAIDSPCTESVGVETDQWLPLTANATVDRAVTTDFASAVPADPLPLPSPSAHRLSRDPEPSPDCRRFTSLSIGASEPLGPPTSQDGRGADSLTTHKTSAEPSPTTALPMAWPRFEKAKDPIAALAPLHAAKAAHYASLSSDTDCSDCSTDDDLPRRPASEAAAAAAASASAPAPAPALGERAWPSGSTPSPGAKTENSLASLLQQRRAASSQERVRRIRFNSFACLFDAALEGDVEEVRHLVETEKIHPDTCNADGMTALHCACGTAAVPVVRYLIERGANINVLDDHGWSPLHNAAYANSLDVARILLEHGADVEATETGGQTALDLTTDHDIIRLISEAVRRKNDGEWVTAIYDFDQEGVEDCEGDELSFHKDDRLRILSREDPDWWLAERQDREGFIPRQFVQ